MIYEGPFEGAQTSKNETQAPSTVTSIKDSDDSLHSNVSGLPNSGDPKAEFERRKADFDRQMKAAGGEVNPDKNREDIDNGVYLEREKAGLNLLHDAAKNHPLEHVTEKLIDMGLGTKYAKDKEYNPGAILIPFNNKEEEKPDK